MLSNKTLIICTILSFSFILYSCGEKKSSKGKPEPVKDYNNPAVVSKEAGALLGPNIKFAYKGNFDQDSTVEIAAGTELQSANEWGIKFYFLKLEKEKLEKIFETPLLQGSFKESLTKKIKFPSYDYELIYYNSQDYFMGSGGGEVFSYIIDFSSKKTFYAHLFSEQRKVSLFLSENIDNPEIKNFFLAGFKKDYSNLKIVSKDVDVDNL